MSEASQIVTVEACESMRAQLDGELTLSELENKVPWTRKTIRRHIRGLCSHSGPGKIKPPSTDAITTAINELADELQRVPSQRDWRVHGHRPWSVSALKRHVDGEWDDVLDAAGQPVVASKSPTRIREYAYQNPNLCEVRYR